MALYGRQILQASSGEIIHHHDRLPLGKKVFYQREPTNPSSLVTRMCFIVEPVP